jgi:hypothetical protein
MCKLPSRGRSGTLTKENDVAKQDDKRQMRLLKLVSGNTVLANVLRTNSTFELHKPMEVIVVPGRDNQTMITLMDFIPGCISEQVTISHDKVICRAEADPRILGLYEQATKPPSPVAQPAKKELLLPGA